MTDLLYLHDSYIRDFEAEVSALDPERGAIILTRTAFYPGGGGQPSDSGTLTWDGGDARVGSLKRDSGQILHLADSPAALPEPGAPVLGRLDWARRYQLMRTHTAMHILCGVIFRDFGASVTGGNMEPLSGRMDFEFETMHKELVEVIEAAVNREVESAREVTAAILPREDAFKIPDLIRTKINLLPEGISEVRVVEIKGLDLQADGGTHVRNTSEVGPLRITDYMSKGKINKRIYLELAE
jgi:misacylated tRNA(Ala) deacylase